MPNRILNFCYNIANKNEIKKKFKDEGQYAALSDQAAVNIASSSRPNTDTDEDSDVSIKSPIKKRAFLNKLFKSKAKNSDDESGSVNMAAKDNALSQNSQNVDVAKTLKGISKRKKQRSFLFYSRMTYPRRYPDWAMIRPAPDIPDGNTNAQPFSQYSEIYETPKPATGAVKRKKRLIEPVSDKMPGYQKGRPGWAKVRPAPDIPIDNMDKEIEARGKGGASTPNDSLMEPNPKPVVTLTADQDSILQEFDPLWTDKSKKKEPESVSLGDILKIPVKPPRNKIINEKTVTEKIIMDFKIPETKLATLEDIQEYELPNQEVIDAVVNKYHKDLAKAKVSYEGDYITPAICDKSGDIKEGSKRVRFAPLDDDDEAMNLAFAELEKEFNSPQKNLEVDDMLGNLEELKITDENKHDIDAVKEVLNEKDKMLLPPVQSGEQKEDDKYQPTEEEEEYNRKIISDFFAEKARSMNDDDIANYSKNIEICKIEIYEEDVKKYHESLKHRRGPIDHDVMYTTVGTALNFVEKLVKEREKKNKASFIPDLIDRCLKTKGKKEEEDVKKKEKEEKKNKGPSKPKLFLVYNKYAKEKVIICTPGEFYDSD